MYISYLSVCDCQCTISTDHFAIDTQCRYKMYVDVQYSVKYVTFLSCWLLSRQSDTRMADKEHYRNCNYYSSTFSVGK